ncbi:NAD-dependent epimerase/dehydratase family protein [Hyphococcus flavus]|uniref:NAD-dependent epimerase/dehydratase family protein n=1 Tax=Hyphococcus flavus TaxID=1866326 RepID=A0AAE9ZIG0_9PROT|nr:NAD-dependent epimerase/dehydratase family protein [Hyphococcus flavus]WDI30900.1 NAD-dependent epimerase/dehydratase family protein [Hyphococcus flavus]
MSGVTLVTGGAGFVGKHLVTKLRAKGERVRSFDLAAPLHEDDFQGSIAEPGDVERAMEGVTNVFHLAGNAQLWAKDLSIFDHVNRQGTACVAGIALNKGVERFVHCSSLTTLVGTETPIGASFADEGTIHSSEDMIGAYPRSKRLAELEIEAFTAKGLDAVIAAPTEPLGPGDDGMTPPTQMLLDFANGKTPAYIDCILNFVPVDSLADGLIAARDRGRRGNRYVLGGENIAMKELLAMVERLTGRPAPKTKMPYWVALLAGAVDTAVVSSITGKPPKAPLTGVRLAGRQVSFSSDKAARELDWRAAPVEPALAAMFEWAKDKGLLKPV